MTKSVQNKLEILTFYNSTKYGVDTVDHLRGSYTVERNTKRGSLVIFYGLFHIDAINVFVIYRTNTLNLKTSRGRRFF